MFEEERKAAERFRPGCLVRIVSMLGEPHYSGREGIVEHIDDAGQLHGTWGGLAVQPLRDEVEIIGGAE